MNLPGRQEEGRPSYQAHNQAYLAIAHTAPAHRPHPSNSTLKAVQASKHHRKDTTTSSFNSPTLPSLPCRFQTPLWLQERPDDNSGHPACYLTMLSFASRELSMKSSALRRNVCGSSVVRLPLLRSSRLVVLGKHRATRVVGQWECGGDDGNTVAGQGLGDCRDNGEY